MLNAFLRQLKAKNRSKNTIKSSSIILFHAEKNIGKPLETADAEDLIKYIELLNDQFSEGSILLYETKLIHFYHFCLNETDDIKYIKLLKKLKSLKIEKPKSIIDPADILLPEDVKRLINVASMERDRCIVATLFESGMRKGELLALTNSMVQMDEEKQEVIFNIPDADGCKTGGRTVVCLEIYGYVQDWMKCNTSDKFIPLSESGIRKMVKLLFKKAGIKKPCNVHMFRHSAITHAVNIGMQQNAISERFWGIPNSDMLNVYIHLSEQMQANAYRNAKGMNGNEVKVINPLASRCVECGRLIQSGNLCKQCEEIKSLKQNLQSVKAVLDGIMNVPTTGIDTSKLTFDKESKKLILKQ